MELVLSQGLTVFESQNHTGVWKLRRAIKNVQHSVLFLNTHGIDSCASLLNCTFIQWRSYGEKNAFLSLSFTVSF